jgi:hypothetical protein
VGVPSFDDNGEPIPDTLETLSPNYTCKIAVPTAGTPISRAVTAISSDGFRFLAQLTPTETKDLAAGEMHVVAIEVINTTTTPIFTVEKHIELVVEEELIP